MSLLREIQAALMQEGSDLGPVLLKLRYLASRLGSDPLEDWVKHEAEGYPSGIELPNYRLIPASYTATFSGPFGSGIKNAPIPPYLIKEFGGDRWNNYEIRQSVAAIDDLISAGKNNDGGSLQINAADLILSLQGNVYEGYACNSVVGIISKASLVELQYAVRNKTMELTTKLEKSLPSAAEISLGPIVNEPSKSDIQTTTNITNQTIYGNFTGATATGNSAQATVCVTTGDRDALFAALTQGGIPSEAAKELVDIAASEEPESAAEPFGKRAKEWLAKAVQKAAEGGWKVGVAALTSLATEALTRSYGSR